MRYLQIKTGKLNLRNMNYIIYDTKIHNIFKQQMLLARKYICYVFTNRNIDLYKKLNK